MKILHPFVFLRSLFVLMIVCLPVSAGAVDLGSDALNEFYDAAPTNISRADLLQVIVAMNGGVLHTFTDADPQFADVTSDNPAYENFMEAAQESWYLGVGDCYGEEDCDALPNDAVQVQLFARIVVNAFGLDATHAAPRFTDAPSNALYAGALQIAADHCILLADAKGKVYPTSSMSKEQVLSALLAVDQGGAYGDDCEFPGASGASSSTKNLWERLFPEKSSSSSEQTSSVASGVFKDMPTDFDEREAITYVQSQGIVSGYEDGTYRPSAKINRAEFMKIVMGAIATKKDIDACADAALFSDVGKNMWFTKYICLGKRKKIVEGYADGTFRPTQNISFVEAAKILVEAFALDSSAKTETDVWYARFVKALENKGAIPLSIEGFSYTISRADMAQMVYRLHSQNEQKASLIFSDLQP